VFGSVVRGESSGPSDLDLLVDMSEGRSLLDLVALGADLEEALGVAVDVVTEKSLSLYLRDRVLAEAVNGVTDMEQVDPFVLQSEMVQDAVVRNLEIVGEAAKRVSPDLHDYFGVDLDLIWDVVATELPAARTRILEELGDAAALDLGRGKTAEPSPLPGPPQYGRTEVFSEVRPLRLAQCAASSGRRIRVLPSAATRTTARPSSAARRISWPAWAVSASMNADFSG
jgi:hypothetical protein